MSESKPEYTLLQMGEITPEARKIAVSRIENYEPMGFDLPGKQKLASDIMNYSKWENASLSLEVERLKVENARLHEEGKQSMLLYNSIVKQVEKLQLENARMREALANILFEVEGEQRPVAFKVIRKSIKAVLNNIK